MNNFTDDQLQILAFAFLTETPVKTINDNFVWLDSGDTIFPDLNKANQAKHSLKRSKQRFQRSDRKAADGSSAGSSGNKIDFHPLPKEFDITTLITRKTGKKAGKSFTLPDFTREIWESQFPDETEEEEEEELLEEDVDFIEDGEDIGEFRCQLCDFVPFYWSTKNPREHRI